VVAAGATTGACRGSRAREFGLAPNTLVVAGTTDGCAAFLATGANRAGDGVTSLGTTLVLKLLSDRPVFAPDYGIYSHRIGDVWLAGGASNSGGAALLSHFTAAEIEALQPRLRPQIDLGLGFYPLPGTGERFPINDPAMTSRISPRPADQTDFLQALLEGIADVEALGYRRLTEIGAPKLISLRSAGGGAGNRPWTEIRRRKLGVPFLPARSEAAAAGVARLALQAMESNAS
jgi:sugar (pentulose or hexulose) kinase